MTENLAALADLPEVDQPTFDTLQLSPEVRRAVDDLGYTHPTPVQQAVFEAAAAGGDLVVQARTGTGKTAAFGLPVIDRLVKAEQRAAQVLILSPTRELALQINRELENLAKHKGISCTAVYGGASMGPQVDAIRGGTQIIAGTPGRVLDHLERGTLDPRTISTLVLDESDEMLSMGFLPQITRIMEQLPANHQTLLFSATLPSDVRRIAETRLKNPQFITLSGDHIGALSIDHFVYRSTGSKAEELIQVLEIENPESAIIFCNTRDQTKRLSTALTRKGFSADWLNADLAQNDREKVMKATREGKLRFLVCTDVAARGIDISHLTHVINADFPESTEAYVHRTGRTGRAGNTGTAISLITPQDVGNLYMLRLTYKIFPVERELPSAGDLQTRKEADLVEFLYQAFANQPQLPADRSLARRVLTSDFGETIVAGLLRDHLGAHPHSEDHAETARREKNPPPAPKKKDKDKKGKKKGDKSDKDRKKHKLHADEDSPKNRPEKARSERHPEGTPLSSAPKTDDRTSPAALTQGLEVVSASALLDADERALLRGDEPQRAHDRAKHRPTPEPQKKPERSKAFPEDDDVGRIFVDAGKRDQIFKDDFVDALESGGVDSQKVVFINIRDTHSFIGVTPDVLDAAVAALDGSQVGGLEVTAEKARPRRSPSA